MELQKFCRERERMCSKNTAYSCPFVKMNGDVGCNSCCYFCLNHPKVAEQIVSDWSKEHPIVTNGNKFCEIMSETFGKDIKISFEHTTDGKIIIRLNEEWWNEEYREQGGNQND